MKCSWKLVLVLICLCLAVQYTAIRSIHDFFPRPCQDFRQCQKCPEKDNSWKSSDNNYTPTNHNSVSTRKHIHLFSQTRSGSSFAGQLFNQHPDIFYMYEPLYHAQQTFCNYTKCLWKPLDRAVQGVYRDLLYNLYTCDLNFLENYIQPEPQDHLTASFFRQTSSHALCSPPVCQVDNKKIIEMQPNTFDWCSKKCRLLNLTLASMACQSRSHVSIKTVRIPQVSDLRLLTEDPRLDLRIIHLVRDPRAILASRIIAFPDQFIAWKIWNATDRQPHYVDLGQITKTCQDMEYSVDIGLKKPAWLHRRYLLVRYEDLALNPEAKAKEIYKFLDLNIDNQVLTWISQNTNVTSSAKSKYSTSRDSKTTTESWRLHLGFDIVKTVQKLCNNTLDLLGYKTVQSEEELRNTRNSLVEPRTFS